MQINKTWAEFKSTISTKKIQWIYEESDDAYFLYGVLGPFNYYASVPKDAGEDCMDFETNYKNKTRTAIQPISKDGFSILTERKSFKDSSRSFVTPDFSDKSTWYYDAARITDEVGFTSDNTAYIFGADKVVIDLSRISDRNDWQSRKIIVKKNDIVITAGFTISLNESSPQQSSIIFDNTNDSEDVIKVTYSYAQTSKFELTPAAGKKISFAYVETQFTVGTILTDILRFELVLNNPNTGNADYVAGFYEYCSAKDYMNKGNHGAVVSPFGELTKDVIVLPWDYQSGYTLKPVGDATTNPASGEFNKIRIYLKQDLPYTECELATGTFYCFIEDLNV